MKLAKNHRALKPQEKFTAFSVFLDTINYDCVRISDGLGGGNRPFTFPGAPLSTFGILSTLQIGVFPSELSGFVSEIANRIVYINFGPRGYADALYDTRTFIHEMTHAWQYMHGVHVAVDSMTSQFAQGNKAYDYDKPAGAPWGLYNVEQQAEIVADWYMDSHSASATSATSAQHSNYKYIQDHIRANKPR